MTQSSHRHKRKAVAAVSKKAAKDLAKDNGIDISREVSLDPAVQAVKIAALERAIQHLVDTLKINHQEIHRAFSMTDAHLWVLRKLCADIVSNTVLKQVGPTPVVDISAYYDLFNSWQKQQAAAAQAAQKAKAEDSKPEDGYEVFGGDSNDANPERDEAVEQDQGAGEVSSKPGDAADPLPLMQ